MVLKTGLEPLKPAEAGSHLTEQWRYGRLYKERTERNDAQVIICTTFIYRERCGIAEKVVDNSWTKIDVIRSIPIDSKRVHRKSRKASGGL